MRQLSFCRLFCTSIFCGFWVVTLFFTGEGRADQVEMVNGDRYVGKVVSMGNETLVIQSEFLGTLKLPRSRIANIGLQSVTGRPATNAVISTSGVSRPNLTAQTPSRTGTNSGPDFTSALNELGTNSSIIQQVQQQFLSGAGPEAQNKFNDLVSGLLNGKLGVNELRNEARSTLQQAKAARKELGEEGGASLDSYLAILEGFLKETETAPTSTNAASLVKVAPSQIPTPVSDE